MTAQVPDCLNYEGQRYEMFSNPLESFFDNDYPRPEFKSPHTACWRGYEAEWEVDVDILYLVGLVGWVADDGDPHPANIRKVGLEDLFPWASERVRATWFTGDLRLPQGKMLEYVHMGYGSTYEQDLILTFDKGKLIRRIVEDNRHLMSDIRRRQAEHERQWKKIGPHIEAALCGRRVPWRLRGTGEQIATVLAGVVFILIIPFIIPYLIYKRGWNPKNWNLF